MANHNTHVEASNKDGQKVSLRHTSTDSPILPVEHLRQLHELDPKLVDWVIQQTEIESAHRRRHDIHINWFIFIERMSGVVAGLIAAIFGLGVGAYVISLGHDWAGTVICGVFLATIVGVLVTREHKKEAADDSPPQSSSRKKTIPRVKKATSI